MKKSLESTIDAIDNGVAVSPLTHTSEWSALLMMYGLLFTEWAELVGHSIQLSASAKKEMTQGEFALTDTLKAMLFRRQLLAEAVVMHIIEEVRHEMTRTSENKIAEGKTPDLIVSKKSLETFAQKSAASLIEKVELGVLNYFQFEVPNLSEYITKVAKELWQENRDPVVKPPC